MFIKCGQYTSLILGMSKKVIQKIIFAFLNSKMKILNIIYTFDTRPIQKLNISGFIGGSEKSKVESLLEVSMMVLALPPL